MNRGDIHWGEIGDWGRRPALIVSRGSSISFRNSVTVAPVTRTVRGIASEVRLGRREGVAAGCAASCDNLLTVSKDRLDEGRAGRLGKARIPELDRALVHALGIQRSLP